MIEAASLSFAIDSSQAVTGAQALDRLTSAATASQASQRALSEQTVEAQRALQQLTTQSAQLDAALRSQAGAIDMLVARVQLASREVGLFRSTSAELVTVLGQLNAAAQLFGTTASGLDSFARASRNIGLNASETVSALQRITQALEATTLAGQRARNVLESYGVQTQGRGPGDEAAVLREYVAARRQFAPDARRNDDDFAVFGSLSVESLAAVANPRYRTIAQQQRSLDEGETQRRVLAQRSFTAQRSMDLDRQRAEFEDLTENFRTFFERTAPGANPGRAELERRRAAGVPPRSEAWTLRPDADGTFSLRGDPRANPFGENFDFFNMLRAPDRFVQGNIRALFSDQSTENRNSIFQRFDEDVQRSREAGSFTESWSLYFDALNRRSTDLTRNLFRYYAPPAAPELPVNQRTAPFDRATTAMIAQAQMDPLDLQRQQFLIQAMRQTGGVDVTGWEALTSDEILQRIPDIVNASSPGGRSQRAVMQRRLEALDDATVAQNRRDRGDRDLMRRAGSSGLTEDDLRFGGIALGMDELGLEDPMTSGEAAQRAQQIAQAIIRIRRTIKGEEDRARELRAVAEELDQDREAGERQRVGALNRTMATQERLRPLLTDPDPRNTAVNTFEIVRERALAEGASQLEANTRALAALTEATISLERMTSEAVLRGRNEVQLGQAGFNFLRTGRMDFSGLGGAEPGAVLEGARGVTGRAALDAARGGAPGRGSSTNPEVLGRAAQFAEALLDAGGGDIPLNAAVGFAGSAIRESGVRPGIEGDLGMRGGSSAGILQWRGQRRAAFQAMFGVDLLQSTMQQQAAFTAWELTGRVPAGVDPAVAARFPRERSWSQIQGYVAQTGDTPANWGAAASVLFGRGADQVRDARVGAANATALEQFIGLQPSQGQGPQDDPSVVSITRARRAPGAAGTAAAGGAGGTPSPGLSTDPREALAQLEMRLRAFTRVGGELQGGVSPSVAGARVADSLEGEALAAVNAFTIQVERAAQAHRDSIAVIQARTQGERELVQAQQQAAQQAAQLRAQAANIRDPATRDAVLARANSLEGEARTRVGQRQIANVDAELANSREDLEDAEYLGANWFRTNSERAALAGRRAARRRVERSIAPGTEGREGRIAEAENVAGRTSELRELERQNQLIRDSFLEMGNAATAALSQIILRGGDARQVMRALLADMASMLLRRATTGLAEQAFSWIGGQLFGGGSITPSIDQMATPGFFNTFAQGGIVTPMAQGDVVHSPFYKPMASGGMALIGEAGSEAVLPLRRDANGNLGVAAAGGREGGHNITVNVNGGGGRGGAADAETGKVVADAVRRALDERSRENMMQEQRVGGMLNPLFTGVRG